MKKTIYSLALISALVLPAAVSAQETVQGPRDRREDYLRVRMELKARMDARLASTTERLGELKDRIEDRKASTTAKMAERKASTTAKRIEVQQNIAMRQMERAAKVFTATIGHLEDILSRVESRIAKVKAAGGDASASESFALEVKTHLAAAKAEIAAFSSIQITADKATDNFEAVRAAGAKVKEHIKAAHESLMNAVRSLVPGREARNATSTNATTTQSTGN